MQIKQTNQMAGGLGFEPRLTESESARSGERSKAWLSNATFSYHYRSTTYGRFVKRAVGILFALALAACGEITSSSVQVIDGDSLVIHGQHIRLHGIDAPETEQTCLDVNARFWDCGKAATAHLKTIVAGKIVTCIPVDRDVYGRTVATCSVDDIDLGGAMVSAGLAIDYDRFSRGRYRAAENEARAAGRGIWSGKFVSPKQWRAERKKSSVLQSRGAYRVVSTCVRTGSLRLHSSYVPLPIVRHGRDAIVLGNSVESDARRRVEFDGGGNCRTASMPTMLARGYDGGAGEAAAGLPRRAGAA